MTFSSYHRPLEAYTGALAAAGFVIERLEEPVPAREYVSDHPEAAAWREVPTLRSCAPAASRERAARARRATRVSCAVRAMSAPLVAVTDHAVERYRQRVRGGLDPKPEIAGRVSSAWAAGHVSRGAAAGGRGAARLGLRPRPRRDVRVPVGSPARGAAGGHAVGGGGGPAGAAALHRRLEGAAAVGLTSGTGGDPGGRTWDSWTRPRRWPSRRRPSSTRRRSSSTRARAASRRAAAPPSSTTTTAGRSSPRR